MKYLLFIFLSASFVAQSQIDYTVTVTKLMALADDCDGGGFCLSAPQDPVFNIWVTDAEATENTYCWIFDGDDNQAYGLWNDIPNVEIANETDVVSTYLTFDLGGFESDNLNTNCTSAFGDDEIFDRQYVELISFGALQNGVPHIDTLSIGGVYFFEIEVVYHDYATLNELEQELSFVVAPNPNNGSFILKLDENNNSGFTALVTDMMGRTVYATETTSNETQIDITNQDAGVYFVTVLADNKRTTQKMILK
jgi:hypothetical protein